MIPAAASLPCPKCRALLPLQQAGLLAPCPACGVPLQFWIFPAWFQTPLVGGAAENLIAEGESSCFYHPGKQAAVPCDACGRFLCALCDCELQGQHFCPGCVSTGRSKGRLASLEPRRTMFDSLAFTLAVVGLLTGPGALLCGPAAVFIGIRSWKMRSSVIPRTKLRSILAIVLGLAGTVGWGWWLYTLFSKN